MTMFPCGSIEPTHDYIDDIRDWNRQTNRRQGKSSTEADDKVNRVQRSVSERAGPLPKPSPACCRRQPIGSFRTAVQAQIEPMERFCYVFVPVGKKRAIGSP